MQIKAIHNYLMAPLISHTIIFKTIKDYKQSTTYQSRVDILRRQLSQELHYIFDMKPISQENAPTPDEVKNVAQGDYNEN